MNAEFVVISVCGTCSRQCGRTRGVDEPNPDCEAPGRCHCLCRESNSGRR